MADDQALGADAAGAEMRTTRSLALLAALLLAAATAALAAPQPAPPDPCQAAPNLPHCR